MNFHKVSNTIPIPYYYLGTKTLYVTCIIKFHLDLVAIKIDAIGITVYYCINISVEESWRQTTGAHYISETISSYVYNHFK